MNPISKQFEVLATRYKRDQFFRAEIKLTLWYAGGVLLLLTLFSYGTLQLFSRTFPGFRFQEVRDDHGEVLLEEFFEGEITDHLQLSLIRTDLVLSLIAIVLCYHLAKKTIAPDRKSVV